MRVGKELALLNYLIICGLRCRIKLVLPLYFWQCSTFLDFLILNKLIYAYMLNTFRLILFVKYDTLCWPLYIKTKTRFHQKRRLLPVGTLKKIVFTQRNTFFFIKSLTGYYKLSTNLTRIQGGKLICSF